MKNVLIVYNSKTGITKKYAENIASFLKGKGASCIVKADEAYNAADLTTASHVLLGCWTSGLFLFLQHPNPDWVTFAKALPSLNDKKTGLFTTYKLATGSMFPKMRDKINANPSLLLRSKNGILSETDEFLLTDFISA